ncbi:MAG TPA: hypothetical protein PLG22_14625 [Kiritimatiellia bacterium]|nr:hypothetical protein [Kiritimatiellia bacterium]
MSDNSKRGPLLRTEKVKRPKSIKAVPRTAVAAEEDPRGKFLFCMGKKVRLIKCEHYELPPSLEYTPDGQQADFLRHSCTLEIETVPPNRFVRAIVYYILKAAIQVLPSGKLSIPDWATPYEIKLGVVVDVNGREWVMECFREEIIEAALGDAAVSSPAGCAEDAAGADTKEMPSETAGLEQPKTAILPGWKSGKLLLKKLPNGREPAVFTFGKETYTVPSGKAWEIVSGMIEADAYEGHGVKLPARAGDAFKNEHRRFYSDIVKTAPDGKRYLRTK